MRYEANPRELLHRFLAAFVFFLLTEHLLSMQAFSQEAQGEESQDQETSDESQSQNPEEESQEPSSDEPADSDVQEEDPAAEANAESEEEASPESANDETSDSDELDQQSSDASNAAPLTEAAPDERDEPAAQDEQPASTPSQEPAQPSPTPEAARPSPTPEAEALSGPQQRGQQIYLRGQDARGEIVVVLGELEMPGSAFPCANCHGLSGEGSSEGGLKPPPINWASLTAPGSKRPAHSESSVARAIAEALGPGGNKLHPAMPRYRMSSEQMADLIAYLKTLGKKPY